MNQDMHDKLFKNIDYNTDPSFSWPAASDRFCVVRCLFFLLLGAMWIHTRYLAVEIVKKNDACSRGSLRLSFSSTTLLAFRKTWNLQVQIYIYSKASTNSPTHVKSMSAAVNCYCKCVSCEFG